MSTSSIDELLLGGKTQQHPETPENQYEDSPAEIEEVDAEEPDSEGQFDYSSTEAESSDSSDNEAEEAESPKREYDDYGNEKEPENEVIRERLKKQARKFQAEIDDLRAQLAQQGASREVQQAAKDFEYNPEGEGDWQQQLARFVRQEVSSMTREQEEHQRQRSEQAQAREFQEKFRQGMDRFDDFTDVVGSMPMDDAMTVALRGMEDPSAFIYAAAKRNPQELERISKLRDPYARMVEMGKLEERMRRNKPTTKAPRPLSRTHEDTGTPAPKKKTEPSIEDLIAKSDAKKLARMKQHRR